MAAIDDLKNPYFRLPIAFDPREYYGSQSWVRFVLEEISALTPRSLELIGLPNMGKSTLLRYVAHRHGALERNRDWLQEPFRQEPHRLIPVLVEFRRLPTGEHPYNPRDYTPHWIHSDQIMTQNPVDK